MPDVVRKVVQLVGVDQATAPHGNELAGLNEFPSVYGLATGHVTISDFALFGEVSRRTLAHETSAMARRAVRFAVYSWAVPSAPGSSSARKESPRGAKHMRSEYGHLQKNAPRPNFSGQRSGRDPLARRRPHPPRRGERRGRDGAEAGGVARSRHQPHGRGGRLSLRLPRRAQACSGARRLPPRP